MARIKRGKQRKVSAERSRRKNMKIVVFLAAAVVLILSAAAVVRISRHYFVRHFLVEEINIFSPDDFHPALDLEPYGITKGTTSLLEVKLPELNEQIRAAHPELEIIEISRRFPDRLDIGLKKRKAVAQVKLEVHPFGWGKDRFVLVDEGGIVFAELEDMPRENLPVISGIESGKDTLALGRRLRSERLGQALQAIENFNSLKVAEAHPIERVEIGDPKNVSLWLRGNLKLELGKEDFRRKLVLFERILQEMEGTDIHDLEIDLRFGDGIVRRK